MHFWKLNYHGKKMLFPFQLNYRADAWNSTTHFKPNWWFWPREEFFLCIILWFGTQIQFLKWNKGNPLELWVKLYFGDRKCYLDTQIYLHRLPSKSQLLCNIFVWNPFLSTILLSTLFYKNFMLRSLCLRPHKKRTESVACL